MPATTSYGKECSASCLAATGATTSRAKSRTVFASCWYSSGSAAVERNSVTWGSFSCCDYAGQRLADLDLITEGDEQLDDPGNR